MGFLDVNVERCLLAWCFNAPHRGKDLLCSLIARFSLPHSAADAARSAFNEINGKYNELDREIRELTETNALDFGAQEEFYPLKGECFQYTDREYTYELCPFNKASQRPENGGSETNLG